MDNVISVFPPHRKSKTTSSEKRGENKKSGEKREKCEVLPNPFSLKDSFVEESNGKKIQCCAWDNVTSRICLEQTYLSLFQNK